MTNEKTYIDFLEQVAASDVAGLKKAQESYGDSWKKRGGVGAFMMLARKWDRLEKRMAEVPEGDVGPQTDGTGEPQYYLGDRYDIFDHMRCDRRTEGVIDDIRDLRRYLALVEAEAIARGIVHGAHRDNVPENPYMSASSHT